jgi:hypothetical protein
MVYHLQDLEHSYHPWQQLWVQQDQIHPLAMALIIPHTQELLENDKIVEHWDVADQLDLLKQIGAINSTDTSTK